MIRARAWGRAAVLATLLGTGACLDAVAPHAAWRANLTLVPVFAVADPLDGTASDVDSFVIIIENPPFPKDTVVVKIPPGEDSIRIEISALVSGGADTVSVTFDGYSSVTGLRLYSGTVTVAVLAGIPARADSVPVSYVGPGSGITALTVSPTAIALQPGGTAQLSYTGFDAASAAMPDDSVPVQFVSRNAAVARVAANGTVTAVADGVVFVLVRSVARSAVRDSARVTVSAAPPPLIALAPASVSVLDTVGTSNPAAQTVAITNAGGGTLTGLGVGTITYGAGATGWLTATVGTSTAPTSLTVSVSNAGLAAGTYTATVPVTSGVASNSPQNLAVTLTMAPPALTSIELAPGFLAARPGDTLTLGVTGKNASGGTVTVANVAFVSRTASVVTVNATTGKLTAVAGGTAVVVATVGGTAISDSMVVAVAANGSAIAAATAGGRAFAGARPGDTVRVRVAVNLRGVAPEKLGSFNAQLTWNGAVLTFVSAAAVSGGFPGPVINSTDAAAGSLRFGGADATGQVGPNVDLIEVVFVAGGSGQTGLTLALTDLSAAATFANLLPSALVFSGSLRVQ